VGFSGWSGPVDDNPVSQALFGLGVGLFSVYSHSGRWDIQADRGRTLLPAFGEDARRVVPVLTIHWWEGESLQAEVWSVL
jgi:hypothetical protein